MLISKFLFSHLGMDVAPERKMSVLVGAARHTFESRRRCVACILPHPFVSAGRFPTLASDCLFSTLTTHPISFGRCNKPKQRKKRKKKQQLPVYKNFNMEGRKAILAVSKVAKMPLLWQIWM